MKVLYCNLEIIFLWLSPTAKHNKICISQIMLHRDSQDYAGFSYNPAASALQNTAVQVEKEALSSSHQLVAPLGVEEHLAVLQRTCSGFPVTHLSVRSRGQALGFPWGCPAPSHWALSLHKVCCLANTPTTFPGGPLPSGKVCQQAPLEKEGWMDVKLFFIRSVREKTSYVCQLLILR